MRKRVHAGESRQPFRRELFDESYSRGAGFEPRIVAEMSGSALRGNYLAIRDQVPGLSLLPMIKANAYGHGAAWAARQLLDLPDLYGLGVATLGEGAELRKELGPVGRRVKIMVCSGTANWSHEKGQYCEKFRLTPVIVTDADWDVFLREGWPERLSYELKFNTGMNRLGLSPGKARSIVKALREKPALWHPDGILSHLASGEAPNSKLSLRQLDQFSSLRAELQGVFPSAHFHLGNSAAIWNQKFWRLKDLTDIVRPGLSLYGVPPWKGAPARGISAVMTLKASIGAIHVLKPGESIGYGGLYQVPGGAKEGVRAAILLAGYADGVHRCLSGPADNNGGHASIRGQATRFIGRVSMDLSAVRCPAGARVGDWVEILGPNVDPWAQAGIAQTIPYELLTSVSGRVQRRYE